MLRRNLPEVIGAVSAVPEPPGSASADARSRLDDALARIDSTGIWNGPSSEDEDPGGFGDSLHRGIGGERRPGVRDPGGSPGDVPPPYRPPPPKDPV